MAKRKGIKVELLKDCAVGLEGETAYVAKATLAGMVARGECLRPKAKKVGDGPVRSVRTMNPMPKKRGPKSDPAPKPKAKKKKAK